MKKVRSLIINTKNEEENIADCIDSAGNIIEEIIVADMQSSDKTREIAKKKGAKVYKIKDYDYVEPARNYAIKKATCEWILILDADERLTASLKRTIKELVRKNEYDNVEIPRKNIIFGKWIKHAGWWPDYHPQLFKRRKFFGWSRMIHHLPNLRGKGLKLKPNESNAIVHYNINNIDSFLERLRRYTKVEVEIDRDYLSSFDKVESYWKNEFAGRFYYQEGFKDGLHGFILSRFMEFYRFIQFARYWEGQGYKEIFSKNEILSVLGRDETGFQNSKFYKIYTTYWRIKRKWMSLFQ